METHNKQDVGILKNENKGNRKEIFFKKKLVLNIFEK